jgi:murein DD-endopeptidase MepM/ murein hydrolase activator NlpD
MGVLRTALQHLVDDHQALVTSYNGSLQQEYNVYVAAAQSPQATSELQLVAVHTPIAVQNAVHTNLDLVQTQLQQEAQIAAAEAQAAAAAQSGAAGLPALALIAGGATPSFHAPVSGVVSQPFGPTQFALEPPLTYNGVFYPHFHTGLDIAAPLDTPLGAAADGVVILATSSVDSQGHLSGYGNYIAIRHSNGFVTLYGHLDRILVSVGQTVQQGQEIGLLGSTGWSTGPHVHFEIRENGVFVDPAPFLAAQIHG